MFDIRKYWDFVDIPFPPIPSVPTKKDDVTCESPHKAIRTCNNRGHSWVNPPSECVQKCLPACHSWVYELNKIPYQPYTDGTVKHMWRTFDQLTMAGRAVDISDVMAKLNMSRETPPFFKVRISFDGHSELIVTKEKQVMGIEGFISNIGGLMGLYLGVSMIGLVHVLVSCCRYLFRNCLKSRREINLPK